MTPRFKSGDKAVIGGRNVEIRSWPQDNSGPFAWVQKLPSGEEIQGTNWVSNTPIEEGQLGVMPADAVVAGETDAPQAEPVIAQSIVKNDSGTVGKKGKDE